MLCAEEELGRCDDDVTVVVEELFVVDAVDADVIDDPVPLLVPPKKLLEASEDVTVLAGYEGGPIEGLLKDEDPRELEDCWGELLEGTEELPPGSLSKEGSCELCGGSNEEISFMLSGSSEPETVALSPSMMFTSPSVPRPEQPESTQIAAAIETAPLNLFFIIHFPNF